MSVRGYFYLKSSGKDDRLAIQNALDSCSNLGRGTVVLEGDFLVKGTLYISDYTTLIIRNGTLCAFDKEETLLTNSNRLRPRIRTLFGTQRGISILGENGRVSGKTELVNVSDFLVRGITFVDTQVGIFLAYVTGGRLSDIDFCGVKSCIKAAIGTRNCYFCNIRASGDEHSISFSSDRVDGSVVYYYGPDVTNNIVRGVKSDKAPEIFGEWCKNNVIL
jgi:hypothetical protein